MKSFFGIPRKFHFSIEKRKNFITEKFKEGLLLEIFPLIEKKFRYTKNGVLIQKRYNVNYGKDYSIVYRGKKILRPALDYTPKLLRLKEVIQDYTGETYDTCFIQYYPSDKVGINPHFDKEVVRGSICSVSLGQTRKFVFHPTKVTAKGVALEIEYKSLMVIKQPTNFYWIHSLEARKALFRGAKSTL